MRYGADVAPVGEKLIMKAGDVLFGKRRAYQKKVASAPFDGIFSAHGMVLRPRENVVDSNFFPLFIGSDYFLDAAISISVGSLSPTINWRDLRELEFDLPPLEEQRKLAKVLWAINDTIEAYKNLIAATDDLVKARFVEMFGEIGTDPHNWGLTTLGECSELNPRRPKDMNPYANYSFVAMSSVSEDGHIDASIEKPFSEICKGFRGGNGINLYINDNSTRRRFVFDCIDEGFDCTLTPLREYLNIGAAIGNAAIEVEGVGEAVNERTKAHTLNYTEDFNMVKHISPCLWCKVDFDGGAARDY